MPETTRHKSPGGRPHLDFDEKTFVVGIGAQKTGTTWLASYFSERRDIYISPIKEMHYFDMKYRPEILGASEQRFSRRLDMNAAKPNFSKRELTNEKIQSLKARIDIGNDGEAYKRFFRDRVPEEINFYGEITPSYALIGEHGFREMRALFPHIRAIFIMRDPVERFYSQVRMRDSRRPAHKVERDDLATKIDDCLEDPIFLERSQYQNTIVDLEKVFEPKEIIYLFYETMFCKRAISDLCDRVGMPYVPAAFDEVIGSSGPKNALPGAIRKRIRAALRPTYKFCREKFGSRLPEDWRNPSD